MYRENWRIHVSSSSYSPVSSATLETERRMVAFSLVWRLCMPCERRDTTGNTKRLVQVVQAFHAVFAHSVGSCQPASKVQDPTGKPIFFLLFTVTGRLVPLCQDG